MYNAPHCLSPERIYLGKADATSILISTPTMTDITFFFSHRDQNLGFN